MAFKKSSQGTSAQELARMNAYPMDIADFFLKIVYIYIQM